MQFVCYYSYNNHAGSAWQQSNFTYLLLLRLSSVYHFSPLAALNVNISLDSMGSPLIAGTNRSLLCSVDSVPVTIAWLKNGSPVNASDKRVTVTMTSQNTSILTINPLHTSDGGQYQCMGTVVSNGTTINITDEIDLNVTSEYTHS